MKPRITSEYAKLKQVLVHTPGKEHTQVIPWEGDHPLMGIYPRTYRELQVNHRDLKKFLVDEIGEENVLELKDLLTEIFANADLKERQKIIRDTVYYNADSYLDHLQSRGIKLKTYPAEEIVRDLIEGYPRELYLNNGRLTDMIVVPKREMMWMRDSAAVTPAGVVINYMASPRRLPEPTLVRTVFKYHPRFDPDSIFLDLVDVHRKMDEDPTTSGLQNTVLLEGGNILVLSKEAIAIGVGRHDYLYSNRTTRAAFNMLVEKLFEADASGEIKRIYLVNVPDLRGFIHLDTVFNMVGPKSAIAMPYIFGHPVPGKRISSKQVMQEFVDWLRKNMGVNQTDLSKIPSSDHFEHAGKVEVYDRDYIEKRGRVERLPIASRYFLPQLIEDGILDLDKITWIGGPMKDYVSPYEHLKVALFEQHNMAGNVFTVSPYRAVAYHRNPVTADALEKDMIKLSPDAVLSRMSSNEIRTDNGGPHCLTMPLLREEE